MLTSSRLIIHSFLKALHSSLLEPYEFIISTPSKAAVVMASSNLLVFLLISSLAWVAMGIPSEANESYDGGYYHGGGGGGGGKKGACRGRIGECEIGDELAMESAVGMQVVRRQLDSTSGYISYGALTADAVPCSTAGASYYDCTSSSAANPYTRSCTTITLCARDTS